MAEYAITGDVATLLGVDHTAGDPAALWVEASQPIILDGTTGRLGGSIRVDLAADGTFTQDGLPETVAGVAPLYRLRVDSHSLRRAGKRSGVTTRWFPLTADRDLTWVVENYVDVTVITTEIAADVAAAAALGATNDTATASFIEDGGSATSAALTATYETQTRANNRAIQVADYGTLGTANDAATINAALAAASGRRLVFPPNATLNTSGNAVTGLSDAVIDGNGATLDLNATGSQIAGLRMSGTLSNVEVRGLRILGNAVTTDQHAGILVPSGSTITDLRITGNAIEGATLGITVSADGAGSLQGVLVEGNALHNIVGTASGYGYGIHLAASGTTPHGVRISNNLIKSSQRHGIYLAKGVGVTIAGNTLIDHRDANATGAILPALLVARSSGVVVTGNTILRPAGGGMFLGGVATGDHAENYTVVGNVLMDAQDGAALAYIGQLAPGTDGIPTGVVFAENMLKNSVARGCLYVYNGKQITIARNTFRVTEAAATTVVTLNGAGVTGNDYMDNLTIEGNVLEAAHASAVLFRVSPGHETDTTRYWFRGNRKASLGLMFATSAAITNPNIDIQDHERGAGFNITATTAAAAVSGATVTTAPSAGAAGALPATPAGYLTVNVNGTDRKVAYY